MSDTGNSDDDDVMSVEATTTSAPGATNADGIDDTPPTAVEYRRFFLRIAGLTMVLLNEPLAGSLLFPIVGLLLSRVDQRPVEESGYRSGILVSMFHLGQTLCSKHWGQVSDVVGRKPVMQFGLLCGSVCVLLFGLSSSFGMLVLFRLLTGLCNANAGVAKTVAAELSAGRPHFEALGFAVVGMTWGVGSCIGLTVGGMLYDPVRSPRFGGTGSFQPGSIWDDYPALLPCLVVSVYGVVANILANLLLQETNVHAVPIGQAWRQWREKRSAGDGTAAAANRGVPTLARQKLATGPNDDSELTELQSEPPVQSLATAHPPLTEERLPAAPLTDSSPLPHFHGYLDLLTPSRLRRAIGVYVLLAAGDIAVAEIAPLWEVTSRAAGGLSFSSEGVGVASLFGALGCVVSNLTSPVWQRYVTKLSFFRVAALLSAVTTGLIPFVTWSPAAWVTPALWLILNVRQVVTSYSYNLIFIAIAHAAPPGCLGSVTGASHSSACLIRLLIAVAITPVFSWTVTGTRVFPLDYHLTFLLAGAMGAGCWLYGFNTYFRGEGRATTTAAAGQPHPRS